MNQKKEQIENLRVKSRFSLSAIGCFVLILSIIFVSSLGNKKTYSISTSNMTCASDKVLMTTGRCCTKKTQKFTNYDEVVAKNECKEFINDNGGICSDVDYTNGYVPKAVVTATYYTDCVDSTCKSGYEKNSNGECVCSAGYYLKNGNCEKCPAGTYCTGGINQPITCGDKYTSDGGAKSKEECKCKEEYVQADMTGCGEKASSSSTCVYTTQAKCQNDLGVDCMYKNNCWVKAEVVIMFYNGSTFVIKYPVAKGDTVITPKEQTQSGKYFAGWGEKGCTSSSLGANHELVANASKTYYACFNDKNPDSASKSSNFEYSMCRYVEGTVQYDENYKGCKKYNISVGNDRSLLTEGNIKECCLYKGYTWVKSNYGSNGGNEYCISCGKSSEIDSSVPDDPEPSSNITDDPEPSSNTPDTPESSSSSYDPGNPTTGSTLIFIVWAIGAITIGYSLWFFKKNVKLDN